MTAERQHAEAAFAAIQQRITATESAVATLGTQVQQFQDTVLQSLQDHTQRLDAVEGELVGMEVESNTRAIEFASDKKDYKI